MGVVFRTFKETSLPNFPPLVLSLLWPHLFPKVYAGLTVPFHPRPSDGLPQYLLRRTGLPWALPQTSPDCFSPGLGSPRVQAQINTRNRQVSLSGAADGLPSRRGHAQVLSCEHRSGASLIVSLEFFSCSPVSSLSLGQHL